MATISVAFDEQHVLHELQHYLPAQSPLKDFIHHNTLHAFQDESFFDAIFKASAIFSYKPTLSLSEYRNLYNINRIKREILRKIIIDRKGQDNLQAWFVKLLKEDCHEQPEPLIGRLRAHWKTDYKADLDNWVQPLLFRILCSYLDQGIALWQFPFEDKGLLNALRELEKNSYASFFKTKNARRLLFDPNVSIESLLNRIIGEQEFFKQYLFDQQFSHRGWSGIVSAVEQKPYTLLYPKKIDLKEMIILELILEIDALDFYIGENKWQPLAKVVSDKPINLFAHHQKSSREEILTIWQEAFEWSYYDEVLSALHHLNKQKAHHETEKSFQAVFCIDERECSIRRYLEASDKHCETLGCPGFFGVEFYFQPHNGKFFEKLCPAPVEPKFLIKEYNVTEERKHDIFYGKHTHTFFRGFLSTLSLGLWASVRLFLTLYRPKGSPAISNAFAHMNIEGKLQVEALQPPLFINNLQVGFTIQDMATRVEALLRSIGLTHKFSSLIYIVAHGSSSANNPHHGAYDCGACSGRPGSVNARVFALMANNKEVRNLLLAKGLEIPDTTQFIAALHDTASDEIAFYDEHLLSHFNKGAHFKNKASFETALDLNAKERSRRFASIDTSKSIKHVRNEIRKRSVSLFEPRPELGHGTNALCFVGNRSLTKGLFLDRRAFMNSYDYRQDPDGKILLQVLKPIPPVCGGINLEYYFSRVDNQKFGAGTKLSHNVMGLIGVANSSDGDLRPGLPLQMIEVHDPVRLLILVEHFPEIISNTIKILPELYQWFIKEWVHLVAIHPTNNKFYYFRQGEFIEYTPLGGIAPYTQNVQKIIESAKTMTSNETVEVTQENLPVYIIHSNEPK